MKKLQIFNLILLFPNCLGPDSTFDKMGPGGLQWLKPVVKQFLIMRQFGGNPS